MVLRRRPPTPKKRRSPKLGATSPGAQSLPKLPSAIDAPLSSPPSLKLPPSLAPSKESPPSVSLTEDRDVYQCSGCLHFSVRCRTCSRGHARRATPAHLRSETAVALGHSTHDPLPKAEDPEGVWEDDTCAVCDGSLVPGMAALLTPRLCSACVECGTHRYRRERPGLGVGPSVSVGGVKGSALGLGSRINDGIDSHTTFEPLSSKGQGTWRGAEECASMIDVDGGGDYYACDRCGSHTVKCAGCDVGMALVPDNPKDFTALYGFPGAAQSLMASSVLGYGGSSWFSDAASPPLCVLCSGFLATQPDLMGVLHEMASASVTLSVFVPQSDPGRRDYARLFAALFHGKLQVVPPEQPVPKLGHSDGAATIPHAVGQHVSVFLPRAIPKAVYIDHPLRPGQVMLLASQFHSLIAQEKCDDLVALGEAMVRCVFCTFSSRAC
jgi:hypothetical protein